MPVQLSIAIKRKALLTLMTLIRVGAWFMILLVIVLSVVPGKMRPHVLANGDYEHFIAYFVTGGLLGISYSRRRQLLMSAMMLSMCAGTLEIVQIWVPDRTASPDNFAASTFGAWTALTLVCVGRCTDICKKGDVNSLPNS